MQSIFVKLGAVSFEVDVLQECRTETEVSCVLNRSAFFFEKMFRVPLPRSSMLLVAR